MISFNIMKYGLKSEFKDRISTNSKSYVIFNSESISKHATFKWEEKDKEFWLNGKLYDIVSTDNSGRIKCINDAQEKLLFQKLDQQINDFFAYNPIGKKALSNSNSVFFAIYLPVKAISISFYFDTVSNNNFKKLYATNRVISQAIATPPPRII